MVANAGVGATPATNDFDNAEIYKDIVDVTVDGNVFVKIPKFYIKKEVNGDTWEWYVSKEKKDNAYYLPECFKDESGNELDYVLIGKYDASLNGTKLESKSGSIPVVDQSLNTYRTYATNNNVNGVTGYQLLDIHALDVLQVLFYIEFSDLNSQNIMFGYANSNNTNQLNNGTTDIVVSTSGSTTNNSDGKSAMKYRGIENLWGNVWQLIDGLYVDNATNYIYVNKNPNTYSNYEVSLNGYYKIGYSLVKNEGFISKMNYDVDNPFLQLPSELNGTSTTKYGDYYNSKNNKTTGISILRVNGYHQTSAAGITSIFPYHSPTDTVTGGKVGTRIIKKSF